MARNTAKKVLDVVVKDLPEVECGRFRVADDGRVYRRRKAGGWEFAPQSKSGRKGGKYLVVGYTENGKQRQYSVHRLVATAYIPNPDNKPEVNHLDGNGFNNRVENLEWTTRRGNCIHAYENGLMPTLATASVPCKKCAGPTVCKDGICSNCKAKEKAILAREKLSLTKKLKNEKRADKVMEILSSIGQAELSERNYKILELYTKGKSLKEIGEKFCVSRQRVDQIIDAMKPEPEYIPTKAQEKVADIAINGGCLASKLSRETGITAYKIKQMLTMQKRMTVNECNSLLSAMGFENSCKTLKPESPSRAG